MDYELAKKLKEAGFPQKKQDIETEEGTYIGVYVPNLSELIEVCGNDFVRLVGILDLEWDAVDTLDKYYHGSTPEQAVANLWLALKK